LAEGEAVYVLDGCEDHCALKKLQGLGVPADVHVVLTEIGIRKGQDVPVRWEDIERILQEIDTRQ
ncbi:MAG TPA: putative zinc-binding protein, partial [Methanomicrobiales archaeon]|nr:putative zinc-binding protein [Methanomicrobiales archaeon]